MDIKRAKQEIEHAVKAYLAVDDTGTPLLVTIDALEVPLWCERFERRGASGAVAAFADFDTERRAQELLGLEFRIRFDEEDDDE